MACFYITARLIRKIRFKTISKSLLSQGLSVRQKQNPLHPTSAHQHINKAHCGPCFTGARSHNKERFSSALIKAVKYPLKRFYLIISINNGGIYGNRMWVCPEMILMANAFKVIAAEEAARTSRPCRHAPQPQCSHPNQVPHGPPRQPPSLRPSCQIILSAVNSPQRRQQPNGQGRNAVFRVHLGEDKGRFAPGRYHESGFSRQ